VRLNLAENGSKALKVLKLLRIEKLVADTHGDLTDAQIKAKLNAPVNQGGHVAAIGDAVALTD